MRVIYCDVCDIPVITGRGKSYYCKTCSKFIKPIIKYEATKRWRLLNKEHELLYRRRWHAEHREYSNQMSRDSYIKNKERDRARHTVWAENNPEKISIIGRRRRAKLHDIVETFTQEEWETKRNATKGICPVGETYVGLGFNMTMYHIFPISKAESGRVYTIDDVVPMCRSCNSSKKNR